MAERLDYLYLHPRINVDDGEGHKVPAPYPWIGDFLLFLRDADGPYCVNWTVKGDTQGFSTPYKGQRPTRNPQKARARTMARHAIEEIYYGDAGIRTVRIIEADISFALALNLREVYVWQARELAIDDDLRRLVVDRVRGCVLTGQPPLATLLALQREFGSSLDDLKAAMYRAIWNRELKVDLFGGPVYPDQVPWRQNEDVLEHYRHWFTREAP